MIKNFEKNISLAKLLARKNLKASDYQSFMGVLWSFMGPALTFLVTYAIFKQRFGRDIPYFPLRLITSIVVLSYFVRSCGYLMRFFRSNLNTLMNSTIPIEVFILSSLFVPTLKFAVEITVCAIAAILLNIFSFSSLFFLPPLIIAFIFFTFGFGFLLCNLYSVATDIEEIWIILSRLFIFITPAFYTLDMLSEWARTLVLYVNPLTSFVLCFQRVISHQEIPFYAGAFTWMLLMLQTFLFFGLGYYLLKRNEKYIIETT